MKNIVDIQQNQGYNTKKVDDSKFYTTICQSTQNILPIVSVITYRESDNWVTRLHAVVDMFIIRLLIYIIIWS